MACFRVDQIATLYDPRFIQLYQQGEPYGVGNEEPLFEVCAVLNCWNYVGRRSKAHLHLELADTSASLVCKWWFHGLENPEEKLIIGGKICVVGTYDYVDRELKCLGIKEI
ncbi:hypothetical protein NHP200010_12160 [Helicobacter bizzozeronii]|uniref:hypothetical protein n=1 Tax=Helicobacter bizzozeronii TaxID=56877 RepID=UPI00244D81DB|nr:hypothetical protein [Helicobacter bizzozeronii]GMB93495.1 hypothetical protein NHP200010_12160 [Helicobacter bizzozeronii]